MFPSAGTALTRWAEPLPEHTDTGDTDEDAETEEPERSLGVTVAGATGRTALGGAVVVERALPRLVPRFNRAVSRLARRVSATGPMHRVLSSPPAVRYEQTEWALPRAALAEGARELFAALADDHLEVGLPVRLRVGAPESGWLHPAHDRPTAWVAVRVPRGTDHAPVLERAYRVLRAHGGRPHWASRSDWTVEDTARAYPRLPDFRRVRDDYDPDRVFATPALAAVLGRLTSASSRSSAAPRSIASPTTAWSMRRRRRATPSIAVRRWGSSADARGVLLRGVDETLGGAGPDLPAVGGAPAAHEDVAQPVEVRPHLLRGRVRAWRPSSGR